MAISLTMQGLERRRPGPLPHMENKKSQRGLENHIAEKESVD